MKTVIEMAQQTLNRDKLGFWAAGMGDLEAFAELVRADEREACAQMIEEMQGCSQYFPHVPDALRARGTEA